MFSWGETIGAFGVLCLHLLSKGEESLLGCRGEFLPVEEPIALLPHVEVEGPNLFDELGCPDIATASALDPVQVGVMGLGEVSGQSAQEEVPPSQVVLFPDGFSNVVWSTGDPLSCVVTISPVVEVLDDPSGHVWMGVVLLEPLLQFEDLRVPLCFGQGVIAS